MTGLVRAGLLEKIASLDATKLSCLAIVVFIAVGIASSLSRGGTLAMLVATAIVLFPALRGRLMQYLLCLGAVVASISLLAWLGQLDPIHEHLERGLDQIFGR